MSFKRLEIFYACPSCGREIAGEKRSYFTCPNCGEALCEEEKLIDFEDQYCGHCGSELKEAKKEALITIVHKINQCVDKKLKAKAANVEVTENTLREQKAEGSDAEGSDAENSNEEDSNEEEGRMKRWRVYEEITERYLKQMAQEGMTMEDALYVVTHMKAELGMMGRASHARLTLEDALPRSYFG